MMTKKKIMTVRNAVIAELHSKNYNQQEIADILNISRPTVNKVLKDIHRLSTEFQESLLDTQK